MPTSTPVGSVLHTGDGPDPGVGDNGEMGLKDELGRNGAAELPPPCPAQSLAGNKLKMFNCC